MVKFKEWAMSTLQKVRALLVEHYALNKMLKKSGSKSLPGLAPNWILGGKSSLNGFLGWVAN